MRRLAGIVAILVALPVSAQGWGKVATGWTKISNSGYASLPAPSGCATTELAYFLGSTATLTCLEQVYWTAATKSLDVTDGRVQAANFKAIGLATPGGITVTPTLTQVGSITTVAGSALVDGDYFTIKYDGGTVPIEFDLSPGDGTTGGRIPLLFTAGDSADLIRDNVILALNAAAPTKLTASSGGAATVALVLDTPGATGDTNTENVADAGFAVTGFADPTHATTVTYQLVACLADGSCTEPGADSTTGTATATLSASNFNRLSWSAVSGAASYKVYRKVAPTSPATVGVIYTGTGLTVDDTGLVGDTTTASTIDGTGRVTADSVAGPNGVLQIGGTVTTRDAIPADGYGGVLDVAVTLPASPSAAPFGFVVGELHWITAAGSAASGQYGVVNILGEGYTGTGAAVATYSGNFTKAPAASFSPPGYNAGGLSESGSMGGGTATGWKIGHVGAGFGSSTLNLGLLGFGESNNGDLTVGVLGRAYSSGAGVRVGVYGAVDLPTLPTESAAGYFDNGAQAIPILLLKDNGVTVGSVNDGGGVNLMREVEASTAGSGAPNILAAAESNAAMTNEGSAAKNYHTLPTAAKGLTFAFVVQDADGLRITANTSDTIRVIDKVTAAAGYIESTTIGSVVTVLAINAVEWVAISVHGTWTDGTFTYDDTGLTAP